LPEAAGGLWVHPHEGRRARAAVLGSIAAFAATLTVCGDGSPPRAPVTGSVRVEGKPAAGAIVVLHPVAGSVAAEAEQLRPTATSERDGSFAVGTWELADGVPAGRWKATVQWFVSESAAADADPETAHLEADRLGGAYADPETTPLVVEVADAAVALPPFDLQATPTGAR
jgi:hypothetical protein